MVTGTTEMLDALCY